MAELLLLIALPALAVRLVLLTGGEPQVKDLRDDGAASHSVNAAVGEAGVPELIEALLPLVEPLSRD
jgi:hypothetical protein